LGVAQKRSESILKALIAGGGIIGGSIAWRLAAEGVKVTVFERGRLGMEASWAAAGMLAPQAEAEGPGPILDICLRGRDAFERIAGRLMRESGVDPEYDKEGILYCALDAGEQRNLEGRARWQRGAGLGGELEELDGAAARRIEPRLSPEVCYALHLPNNRRVENRKLTRAYVAAAIRAGAEFREGAPVAEIVARNSDRVGLRLEDGSRHEADFVINAAGAWAAAIRGLEADRITMRPVRGQIVCFQGQPGMLGPAIFSLRGYLVPRRDGRLLAGSTMEEAGFDRSVTMAGVGRIVAGANALVPALGALAFREAWAGFRPATEDKLPILGPSAVHPNVFWATAHFRSGILLSALTGEVIADLVMGRKPSFDLTPFSPRRFSDGGVSR
jgi:glycine oxidase